MPEPVRTATAVRRLAGMVRGGAAAVAAAGGLADLGYYLVVTGKLTIDTGWGRRVRPLGRFGVEVAAPAGTVFDADGWRSAGRLCSTTSRPPANLEHRPTTKPGATGWSTLH